MATKNAHNPAALQHPSPIDANIRVAPEDHTPPKPKVLPTTPWGNIPNNKRIFINIVGTVAAVISSITLIPQLAELIETRNVSGLSLGSYSLVIAVSVMWMMYHSMTGTYHGLVSSSMNLIFGSVIFYYIASIRYFGAEGNDTR
jgi:MtN3 and saliva related transmembrane protein